MQELVNKMMTKFWCRGSSSGSDIGLCSVCSILGNILCSIALHLRLQGQQGLWSLLHTSPGSIRYMRCGGQIGCSVSCLCLGTKEGREGYRSCGRSSSLDHLLLTPAAAVVFVSEPFSSPAYPASGPQTLLTQGFSGITTLLEAAGVSLLPVKAFSGDGGKSLAQLTCPYPHLLLPPEFIKTYTNCRPERTAHKHSYVYTVCNSVYKPHRALKNLTFT